MNTLFIKVHVGNVEHRVNASSIIRYVPNVSKESNTNMYTEVATLFLQETAEEIDIMLQESYVMVKGIKK